MNIRSYSKGHIDAFIRDPKGLWRFSGIYGNPNWNFRHETWALLKRLKDNSTIPWVLGGDFNEITCEADKSEGVARPERLMFDFREAIDSCNLIDPGYIGPDYTWCNKHFSSDLIWKRLDRFLFNSEMKIRCSSFKVYHLALLASDHRPILAVWMESQPDQRKRMSSRPKKFEESWTKYGECREIVTQVWKNLRHLEARTIQDKMKMCLSRLSAWRCNKYGGSLKGAIERMENEIKVLLNRNDAYSKAELEAKERELENLLEDDKIYWKQRAREEWLQWGDRNTKWFHLKASTRQKTNKIHGLTDELGNWVEEDVKMERLATNYFQNLFQSSSPQLEAINFIVDSISASITEDQNSKLISKLIPKVKDPRSMKHYKS